MRLAPATRLGSYEILMPIGAGGMGEVYRARDLALKRDVALKTLPASFANDEGRMARFKREARVRHASVSFRCRERRPLSGPRRCSASFELAGCHRQLGGFARMRITPCRFL
jgi:hypothetical protein